MSAHLSVPGEEQFPGVRVCTVPRKAAGAKVGIDREETNKSLNLAGTAGVLVVVAILGMCVYVIVQYLL